MTPDELRRLTSLPFQFCVLADDGTILIAGPLPPPYDDCLCYELSGDGCVEMPEEDFHLFEDAWDRFAADLRAGDLRLDVPVEWRPQGDALPDEPPARRYRTKRLAGETDRLPDRLPIITLQSWENSMTFAPGKCASLVMMDEGTRNRIAYEDGKLKLDGREITDSDMGALLADIRNHAMVPGEKVDLRTLRFLYGIALIKYSENIEDVVRRIGENPRQFLSYNVAIYIPDYVKALGMSPHINQRDVQRIIDKIESYSPIWGIVETNALGRPLRGFYPVVRSIGYEESDNTLTFTSPYMNRIITLIIRESIRRDGKGNFVRKKNGELVTDPSHSYHVKTSVMKNSSEWAKDIVDVVCVLLDVAGDTLPHIKFSKIIERCDGFGEYIRSQPTTYKQNRVLKRSFATAWKLLAKDTDLLQSFQCLKLPDPNDPDNIPTMKTLNKAVEFKHKGKVKQSDQWARPPL